MTPTNAFVACLLISLLVAAGVPREIRAQDVVESPDVVVTVDGLACPFCAYGLEKKLKKLEGIQAISLEMEEGEVRLKFKAGEAVSEERISQAVADAGFTVREFSYPSQEDSSGRGTVPTGARE